jgi:hypothetical protein
MTFDEEVEIYKRMGEMLEIRELKGNDRVLLDFTCQVSLSGVG